MTIKLKYNFIFIFILILFFLIIFLCIGNKKSDYKKIRLNEVTRTVFYCPQYAAIELGYFKDEGIEIDLSTASGSDKSMTALLSGNTDIALSGAEALVYVYKEGRRDYAVSFAQLTKRDGNFIIGNNIENFSWQNLNGKKILSGRRGGIPQMLFLYIISKKNIKAEILNNVQFDSMTAVFLSGAADYVNLFEPAATELTDQSKYRILKDLATETQDIPYTVYCCTKKYMESNGKILQKFTNAIYKAQIWIKENSAQDIAKLIFSYFPCDNFEILVSSIKKYKKIGVWSETPVVSENSINFLQEIIINAGEIENKLDITPIFYNQYALNSVNKIK